MAKDGKK
jgi:hypothetical protein